MKRLVSEAARGQDLGAGRAIYATRAEPFVVQDPRAPGSNSTEGFRVAHSPAYVSLVPETPNGVGRVGETRVAIVVPADVPPTDDSPNAHFTKFGASSQRPFTTQWTVRVSGTIRLRVETASPILLGPRGLGPAALEEAWPLDFTISFAAYSGWNLTGVRYRPSDTLFSDIVKFLDGALETVFPILRWVLDFFRKGLEILRDLAERISDFATRVVREIGVLFSRLVDILHKLAMQALSIVGSVLDFVRAYLPANLRFSLYVSGIGLDVLANGPSGRALVLGFNLLGRGEITFLRLEDSEYRGRANGATYDVLGAWNASVGALHQDGAFDPLAIVQPRMIQGTASWDRAWHADFAGPEFESRLLFDQSYGFTLFLPEGTEVGGKVGVEVLVAGNPFFDFNAALQRSVAEGFEEVGLPRSWQDLGRLVAAIARRVKANVLDQVEATIPEMGAYVQLDAAEIGAGGGVRLSVVADGHSTRLIVQWIADNAVSYFELGFNPFAILESAPPPREVLEHTWLRFDAFSSLATPDFLVNWGLEAELRVAARIEPNFAAMGRLLGRDWGAPVVRFGLLVDGRVKLSWLGAYDVLYLLRGSVAFG